MAVNSAAMRGMGEPGVMPIQPVRSDLGRLSRTPATTPSPSKINTRVPMNSPKKGEAIRVSPLDVQTNASRYCSTACQGRRIHCTAVEREVRSERQPALLSRSQHQGQLLRLVDQHIRWRIFERVRSQAVGGARRVGPRIAGGDDG